jgi:hypothetical protein
MCVRGITSLRWRLRFRFACCAGCGKALVDELVTGDVTTVVTVGTSATVVTVVTVGAVVGDSAAVVSAAVVGASADETASVVGATMVGRAGGGTALESSAVAAYSPAAAGSVSAAAAIDVLTSEPPWSHCVRAGQKEPAAARPGW